MSTHHRICAGFWNYSKPPRGQPPVIPYATLRDQPPPSAVARQNSAVMQGMQSPIMVMSERPPSPPLSNAPRMFRALDYPVSLYRADV